MPVTRADGAGGDRDGLRQNVGQHLLRTGVATSSHVKKLISKYYYPYLSRRLDADDMIFLNYGYEEDPPMGLALEAPDERDRYCIQLYHATATQSGAELAGKKVLEVSCGHGGGASYLMRTLKPAAYTGLDFNPDGIAYCRKRHHLPGLDFVHGDAEQLPFPDESFDAVINVEASHVYPSCARFLTEVARVLRPGGQLLYTDLRGSQDIPAWEVDLAEAPLRMVSKRDINAEVLRGLDQTSKRWLELVGKRLPFLLRPLGRQIVPAPGSRFYGDMQSGQISYRMYSFVKD
ncbi:MAG: phthiotriol/phenolphthiotriol dimycocerosates methyltransferase [Mycolicibacterium sp.]|uniref:phthiotriol/phenolphthiotriol dimycocerosates methyltransferase n=1 Tax=Mycolicibacterium sp. TaxID=2320850 RepID=UPI003D0B3BE5